MEPKAHRHFSGFARSTCAGLHRIPRGELRQAFPSADAENWAATDDEWLGLFHEVARGLLELALRRQEADEVIAPPEMTPPNGPRIHRMTTVRARSHD